jgi:hypothetical protein
VAEERPYENHRWFRDQSKSYRMGFIEASDLQGERNCYRLQDGASDTSEYERGFKDGTEYRQRLESLG